MNRAYLIRRVFNLVPTFLGITFLSYLIIYMSSGDYLSQLALNPEIDEQTLEKMRQLYGLDKSFFLQYFTWLWNVFRLDFGISLSYKVPVINVVLPRLWNTFILSFSTVVVVWTFAIPVGMYCAVRKDTWSDGVIALVTLAGMSAPTFFVAFLAMYGASLSCFFPVGGMYSALFDEMMLGGKILDLARHLILPVAVLSFASFAGLMRLFRSSVITVLKSGLAEALRARGIPERRILFVHVLRNALNPMVTIFGYQFAGLLSGVALTEIILSWPGIGRLMLDAVLQQDIYVIMAELVISSGLLLLGNLIADILLAFLDPRISQSMQGE